MRESCSEETRRGPHTSSPCNEGERTAARVIRQMRRSQNNYRLPHRSPSSSISSFFFLSFLFLNRKRWGIFFFKTALFFQMTSFVSPALSKLSPNSSNAVRLVVYGLWPDLRKGSPQKQWCSFPSSVCLECKALSNHEAIPPSS